MNELKDLRKKIEEIDRELQVLLRERMQISSEIGRYKLKQGLPIQNKIREEEIISKICGCYRKEIQEIYHSILKVSRDVQKADYFLVGGNLSYSFSPLIYRLFGLPAYQLYEAKDFNEVVKIPFQGINITNPFKKDAYKACSNVSPVAARLEAANVIVNREGAFYGDNTDYHGFACLLDHYGIDVSGKKVIIIGNGATAKVISAVLSERSVQRIIHLVRNMRSDNDRPISSYADYYDYDLIINATPYGTHPHWQNEALFPLRRFKNLEAAIDVVYNPHFTPLLKEAKSCGIKAVGGSYMLVAQAAWNMQLFQNQNLLSKIEEVHGGLLKYQANLVLIGMPYAGKSYLGLTLSKIFGKEYFDPDRELAKEHEDLPSVIASKGLSYFRKREAEITGAAAHSWNQVIACGGGIVLSPEVMSELQANGVIIFLDTPLSELEKRIDGTRPLVQNREDLERLYRERIALYRHYAQITIKNEELTEIVVKINEYLSHQWS
jgi:shikimate dehydrogenase